MQQPFRRLGERENKGNLTQQFLRFVSRKIQFLIIFITLQTLALTSTGVCLYLFQVRMADG